jgi:phosphoglycolate phosphatase
LAKYEHIIWDWNGTLINDAELCVQILNTMLKKYGKPPVEFEDYREEFDFPVKDYYAKIGIDFNKYSYQEIADEFINEYNRRRFECPLHDGVIEALQQIFDAGLGQSILSAYRQNMLMDSIEHFKIGRFFTNICGLDDHFAVGKMELGIKLVKTLNISKSKILMVGDTVHDYHVSKEIGIGCVLIPDGHHSMEKLLSSGAKVVESIADVLKVAGL